jgi:hypothetical protein
MTRSANSELVLVAWLKTVPGIGTKVATRLPADNTSWAASGFAVVSGAVGGAIDLYVPQQRPVMQVDCYAINVGSDNPPWDIAADLASTIIAGTYDTTLLNQALTLRTGYEQARVTGVSVDGGPRRMQADTAAQAWYQLDLRVDWIAI